MSNVAKLYGKLGFPKSLFGISWAGWDKVGFLWVSLGFCGLTWDMCHKNANSGETFWKTRFSEEFIWD